VAEPRLIAALGPARDFRRLVAEVQAAERAGFDAVLLDADGAEPIAMLAGVATATTRIGLIASAGTRYNEPYNLARQLLSLDHLSEGRAGWHLAAAAEDSWRYGFAVAADEARVAEFWDVVAGLWDSWEDGALKRDKAGGDYMDRDRVHFLDHRGEHFRVRGPLNISRSKQGWPVVAQSPTTEAGRALAARSADIVFTAPADLAEAKELYGACKTKRNLVMPTTCPPGELEQWFQCGAADGFLVPPGVVRRDPAKGDTLREQLGLEIPVNRYAR